MEIRTEISDLDRMQYSNLRKIRYHPEAISFYQLIYPACTRYLFKSEQEYILVEPDGSILKDQHINALGRKVSAFERIMGKHITTETVNYFLRLDSVAYIISEFLDGEDDLYVGTYPRLREQLDTMVGTSKIKPLDLFVLAYHYEYIYDSLITNLGLPDNSENYFHKLNRMVNRLLESLEFLPKGGSSIQTVIGLVSNLMRLSDDKLTSPILVWGYKEGLVLRNHAGSGIDTLVIRDRSKLGSVINLDKKIVRGIAETLASRNFI